MLGVASVIAGAIFFNHKDNQDCVTVGLPLPFNIFIYLNRDTGEMFAQNGVLPSCFSFPNFSSKSVVVGIVILYIYSVSGFYLALLVSVLF